MHQPYSQGRLPDTFMLDYKSTIGNLRAIAIAIPDDDSDSDGEYYSLNQYSAACLVRYLPESLAEGRLWSACVEQFEVFLYGKSWARAFHNC